MNTLPVETLTHVLSYVPVSTCLLVNRKVCVLWHDVCTFSFAREQKPKIMCRDLIRDENYVNLLTWAFSEGCPKNYKLYLICCHYKLWHVVRWLRSVGTPWNYEVCNAFAKLDYETLVWSLDNRCVTSDETWTCGLQSGDIRTVRLLHDIGVLKARKVYGHGGYLLEIYSDMKSLEIWKFCIENEHNNREEIVNSALRRGTVDVIQYLVDSGVSIKKVESKRVYNHNIDLWLMDHGREPKNICYYNILADSSGRLLRWAMSKDEFNVLKIINIYANNNIRIDFDMLDMVADRDNFDWSTILGIFVRRFNIKGIHWMESIGYDWYTNFNDVLDELYNKTCYIMAAGFDNYLSKLKRKYPGRLDHVEDHWRPDDYSESEED
jgi:hypothetical protein